MPAVIGAIGVVLALWMPAVAHANAPQTLGLGARAIAMGGAFTAQADDASATFYNPAGLARPGRAEASLAYVSLHPDLWAETQGAPRHAVDNEAVGGWFISVGGPAGALIDLPELALGLMLFLPGEHLLDIRIPERPDARIFPLLEQRMGRLSVIPAAGLRVVDGLYVGLGMDLFLELGAPTEARYRRELSHPDQEALEIDLTRRLDFNPSIYGGVLVEPAAGLSFGLTYRQSQQSDTGGESRFYFGEGDEPTMELEIFYTAFFSPTEIAGGVSWQPNATATVNADVTYALWSDFVGPHGDAPDPRFSDVLVPRLGVAFAAASRLDVRLGYFHHPSPIPEQRGTSNFLDTDRHVLSGGIEVDLSSWAPLALLLFGQVHLLGEASLTKDPAALVDRDEEAPGLQTDQLGYPAGRHGGSLVQVGAALSWRGRP